MSDDPRQMQESNPVDDDNQDTPKEIPGNLLSPIPGQRKSPIRPQHPNPPKPHIPTIKRPSRPSISTSSTSPSSELSPEPDAETLTQEEKIHLALENLRKKLQDVVQEYSDGTINQAQFNAIYKRYNEQLQITEKLIERDPASGAWQTVVQPGHTSFLRDHFSSKILSYGLYRIDTGEQIILQGKLRLPQQQLAPILFKLKRLVQEGRIPKPAWRKLSEDRWVVLLPGRFSASVVIYSLEPAQQQRQRLKDVHEDFERANEKLISQGIYNPEQLVFPHRTLFES